MPEFNDEAMAKEAGEMLKTVMQQAGPALRPQSSMSLPLKELTIALAAIGMIWGRNTSDWSVEVVKRRAFELGTALFNPLGALDE